VNWSASDWQLREQRSTDQTERRALPCFVGIGRGSSIRRLQTVQESQRFALRPVG